jgi:hypothetical protein
VTIIANAKDRTVKTFVIPANKEISILQMVVSYIYTKLYHSFDALAPNAKDLNNVQRFVR